MDKRKQPRPLTDEDTADDPRASLGACDPPPLALVRSTQPVLIASESAAVPNHVALEGTFRALSPLGTTGRVV